MRQRIVKSVLKTILYRSFARSVTKCEAGMVKRGDARLGMLTFAVDSGVVSVVAVVAAAGIANMIYNNFAS